MNQPIPYARGLAAILLANAVVTLPWLGATTLWNADEGRIAEIAREMAVSGDWVVPRLGGEPYGSYPPLAYWLMAASGLALGFNEFAMRLPGALAGVGLIAVVGLIGRRLAGDSAGLASAMVIATLPGFGGQQGVCRADIMLALASAVAFDRFLAVAEGDRRLRNLAAFYLAMAVGFLAKGPLALAIPGLGIGAWLAIHRRWRVLLDLKPWFGAIGVASLVLPWYVAVYRAAGWDFIRLNLLLENVSAFASGFEHPRPWWYLLLVGSYRVVPWFLFPLLAWPVRRTPGLGVAAFWAGAVMTLLTISASKRANYLTFFYPAFSLAVGIALAALIPRLPRRVRTMQLGLGAAGVAGAAVVAFAPIRWTAKFAIIADLLPSLAVAAAAGALVILVLTAWRGAAAGTVALAGFLLAGTAVDRAVVDPRLDDAGVRGREFCRRIAQRVARDQPLCRPASEDIEGAYHFYVGRTIAESDAPGFYLATAVQRDRFVACGRTVETLDTYSDEGKCPRLLLRVTP